MRFDAQLVLADIDPFARVVPEKGAAKYSAE
jgi:hypothetical protein